MKKIGRYIWFGLLLSVAVACRKEDDITPEAPTPNYFYPDESETDVHAQLCRNFYAETGCYLLLNDTLKHEYTGTDRYGNPLYSTELLDLTYGVTSSVRWKFKFHLSTDYQRELQATEIIKNDILRAMDKRYHPYSFLLVDYFESSAYQIEEGEPTGCWSALSERETYYIGSRAIAMSIDALLQDKETLKNRFFRRLLENQLTTSVLKEFYAPGERYYGKDDITEFENDDDFINRTGILAGGSHFAVTNEGLILTFEAHSKTEDRTMFLDPLLNGKEEEFTTKYAKYPIVLEKFRLLKEIVLDLGFNIN